MKISKIWSWMQINQLYIRPVICVLITWIATLISWTYGLGCVLGFSLAWKWTIGRDFV